MHSALLDDRAVMALSGAETRDFLQGIVSNDMTRLTPAQGLYAGLLTPQGKILFDFLLIERDEGFLIDCAKDRAAGLAKRMTLYRLRAKVDIAVRPDLKVAAFWGADSLPGVADPRLPQLGSRLIGTEAEIAQAMAGTSLGEYAAHRIGLGVPDSADLPSDTVLALDAGFEELNGVSFKKGCYVGQEVTARMKHRATARKRFVIVAAQGALPAPGTPIESQERELGAMAASKGSHGLALVRLDRLAEAQEADAPITAGGQMLTLRKPAWLAV